MFIFTVITYNKDKGDDKKMNMFNNALLKECRKIKGLTQYDASKIVGVARTTYADYENGKIQPPIDKIHKICDWLDLPLEKLMNIQYTDYAELDNKNEIVNALDDIATEVKLLKLKDQEKYLIINLLDYIAQNYIRKERAANND
jgi:transcriptional regulator with XRE-family HTH domain